MNLLDKIVESESQWKNCTLRQFIDAAEVRKSFCLIQSTVPTTDTGALAEKAKTWKAKPIKGIRHISPVASA